MIFPNVMKLNDQIEFILCDIAQIIIFYIKETRKNVHERDEKEFEWYQEQKNTFKIEYRS